MLKNLKAYEEYLKEAVTGGAQIIVFPEYGLTGPGFPKPEYVIPFLEEIPNPDSHVNPCLDWQPNNPNIITYTTSCLASQYKIVIVLDMADNVTLPNGTRARYNTQVAFDSDGRLLQKYHKTHLYYEPEFDTPVNQPPKSFKTSFGVTFGMGICFDIIFEEPMMSLVRAGIKDFVYSTWWVNTPPILSAVTMQQSWSFVNQVNLLASGAGTGWFNSGSGIYLSGIPIHYIYNSGTREKSVLFVSSIPDTSPVQLLQGPPSLPKDIPVAPLLQTAVVMLNQSEARVVVSVENVTCTLDYSIQISTNQSYALVAYDGYYWPTFRMTSCALYVCDPGVPSCLRFQRFTVDGQSVFQAGLQLQVEYTNNNTRTVFPIVSQTDGQLVPDWAFDLVDEDIFLLTSHTPKKIQGFGVLALDNAPG